MGVVLFANELGAGLGHITRMLPIARALKAHGHDSVIAVHDVAAVAPALSDDDFPVIQAPFWRGRCFPKNPTRTFACLLADRGFARRDVLEPHMAAWLALIDLIKPDLIVADHSPTVCAAINGTIPIVVVGDGFTLPPSDGDVFPPLRADVPPVLPEPEVLHVVRDTQKALGIEPFEKLTRMYGQAHRFLVNLPHIDPYRPHRTETVHGPLQPPPGLQPIPEDGGFYAYLFAGHPLVGKLLQALAQARVPGQMFVHEATAEQREQVRGLGYTVYDEPQPLEQVLGRSKLVIHHGGAGVTTAALSVGRPQVLLPRYLEQRLTGAVLFKAGIAASFHKDADPGLVVESVQRGLADPLVGERAQAIAQQIADAGPYDTLSKVVDCCLSELNAANAHGQPAATPRSLTPYTA